MKRRKYIYFQLFLIILLSLIGCNSTSNSTMETLKDIVYSNEKDEIEYTVFIPEKDEMIPYLVLTANYNGNCLLLRKYVLNDLSIFNHNVNYSSYYENSFIDKMLNTDFRLTLPKEIEEYIILSDIAITNKGSLQGGTENITYIQREVFLLSAAEVSELGFRTIATEGKTLEYFNSNERRLATTSDGNSSSWWLRTPNMWYDNVVCGVDSDGIVGIGGIGAVGNEEYKNGVRPAFCLSADTKIYIKDGKFYIFPIEESYDK